MLETAILKVFASDSLWTVVYETMQVLGGRSFFCDEPYERMMRDARLNMIGEGSNDLLRVFIGLVGMRDVGRQLEALAAAVKTPIRRFGTLWGFGRETFGRLCQRPAVPVRFPQLAGPARALGWAVRRFGFAVERLLVRYRENVVERQLALDRIANCAIALYTTAAVLSKLDSDLARADQNEQQLANDLAVGKLYCQQAIAAVGHNLGSLFANDDETIEAVADQL